GELPVHRYRRAYDLAAERLADGLVPEAHAENGNALRGLLDQIEADAGFIGRAGPRREHDRVRICREHVGARELVVAMHSDLRPQPAEIMDEVEGEAVVIIDQDDHFPPRSVRVLVGGGRRVKATRSAWRLGAW